MKKVVLLIDGDSLIYAACVVPKEESIDGFQHDIEEAKLKFDNIFHKVVGRIEDMQIDYEYIIFVEGDGNVRKLLDESYKANRKEKPPLLKEVTDYVLNQYVSFQCYNTESDDAISVTWHTYKDMFDLIVCSPDKDLKQLACSFYDTYHGRDDDKRMYKISEEEAERFFYGQMLLGDTADNVKGIKGFGKVRVKKALFSLSTSSLRPRTYREYVKCYGRNAKLEFLKAYYLMRLPKEGVFIPDLNSYLF